MGKDQRGRRARRQKSPEAQKVGTFKGERLTVKYKSRPAQLELDVCFGWGAVPGALTEPHEDTSAQDDQVPDPWLSHDGDLTVVFLLEFSTESPYL